jgi:uncharacterized protein YbaP (TraB family)
MKWCGYKLAIIATGAMCAGACSHDDASARVTPAPPPAAPTPPAVAPPPPRAVAPPPTPAAPPADSWGTAPVRDPLKRVMMWEATKDGKTLYLLGTMHLGVDAEERLPDIVWKDFDRSPAFAMETDLTSAAAVKMQSDVKLAHGTLHEELGSAYWKKLEDAITPAMAAQFDDMKPFVPLTVLSMKGLPSTPPMDGVLRARAERLHKQLVFLEDAATDEAILERWMDKKALIETLDDLPDGEKRQQEMLAAYLAGDDQRLLALDAAERASALAHGYTAAEYDAEEKDLLYDRNASWIPVLEKMAGVGGGFVAVGALHLIGPGSVTDRLAKAGFVVTRIEP